MKVLSFGEVLWDIYPDEKFIGGAPLNFAAHFSQCGGEAYLCSAVGRDELGDTTVKSVQDLGVCTKYLTRSEKPTGRCLVTLDEMRVPHYDLLDCVAYDDIALPNNAGDSFDVLYFGTLSLRHEKNRETLCRIIEKMHFGEIFVDVNIRKPYISRETAMVAVNHATILKISDEELSLFAELCGFSTKTPEKIAAEIFDKHPNVSLVLITMGGDGAIAYSAKTKTATFRPAEKVDVVSTVGAGDSFSASFLKCRLDGKSLDECLAFAVKVSGFVVSKMQAVPCLDEILA